MPWPFPDWPTACRCPRRYRFFKNHDVTLPHVIEPLHQVAQQWRQQTPDAWGLVVRDWSATPDTRARPAGARLNHRKDRGYGLYDAAAR